MSVRCKMQLVEVADLAWSGSKRFRFAANYDHTIPEDVRFAKASPSGSFEIHVDNEAVFPHFTLGAYYYFDMTAVPPSEKPE